MSFSDQLQEYLLVRPPQSTKPGKSSSQNLQIQRLLPLPPPEPKHRSPGKSPKSPGGARSPTLNTALSRRRIMPILNLVSHVIRKPRVMDSEKAVTLCKFDREPRGVLGKWQVDMRRGDGGGWIFVGKYERYEWAREVSPPTPSTPKLLSNNATISSKGGVGEVTWNLVRSTYSRSKSIQALSTSKRKSQKSSALMDSSRTRRASMDDTSPERKLSARISISPNTPPSVIIVPRNPRTLASGENDAIEEANREEVIDTLIQGLWIVWRGGIIKDLGLSGQNTLTRVNGEENRSKRGVLDVLLCHG